MTCSGALLRTMARSDRIVFFWGELFSPNTCCSQLWRGVPSRRAALKWSYGGRCSGNGDAATRNKEYYHAYSALWNGTRKRQGCASNPPHSAWAQKTRCFLVRRGKFLPPSTPQKKKTKKKKEDEKNTIRKKHAPFNSANSAQTRQQQRW